MKAPIYYLLTESTSVIRVSNSQVWEAIQIQITYFYGLPRLNTPNKMTVKLAGCLDEFSYLVIYRIDQVL